LRFKIVAKRRLLALFRTELAAPPRRRVANPDCVPIYNFQLLMEALERSKALSFAYSADQTALRLNQ